MVNSPIIIACIICVLYKKNKKTHATFKVTITRVKYCITCGKKIKITLLTPAQPLCANVTLYFTPYTLYRLLHTLTFVFPHLKIM